MKKYLLIISFVLVISLTGCKLENNSKPKKDNSNVEQTPLFEKITLNEIENIIDNELYVLWNKEHKEDISNAEKLTIALKKYAKDHNYDSIYDITKISKKEMTSSFAKTSISYLPIKHETIKGSFLLSFCEHDKWIYDEDKDIYTQGPDGHGACAASIAYKNLVEFKNENSEYKVTYKYAFDYTCEGDLPIIYGSYDNAINDKDRLFSITDYDTNISALIESKYSEIADKLSTYTYTFAKKDGQISLVDYKKN